MNESLLNDIERELTDEELVLALTVAALALDNYATRQNICRMLGIGMEEGAWLLHNLTQVVGPVTTTFTPVLGLINNPNDLGAQWIGQDVGTGESAESLLKHWVYKFTDCGAWIRFAAWGVELGSIVEGSDTLVGPFQLLYPFSKQDYLNTLGTIEKEAARLWAEANNTDEEDE